MQPRPNIESQNSDNYAFLQRHTAFTSAMLQGIGSQFNTRSLRSFKEMSVTSHSPSDNPSSKPTPVDVSKTQGTGSCTICPNDNYKYVGEKSTLYKTLTKCLHGLIFNYKCNFHTTSDTPWSILVARPTARHTQSTTSTLISEPVLVAVQDYTPQPVPRDIQPSHALGHRKTSTTASETCLDLPLEGQSTSTSLKSHILTITERLSELALEHSSHDQRSCPLSNDLLIRSEQLGNQTTRSQSTTAGPDLLSIVSAGEGSGSSHRQTARQPLDSDTESGRENSGGEDDGHNPGDGEDPAGGSTRRTLACPLAMNQRYLRDHPECRRCLTANLADMHAVVQHMRRTHRYCVKCYRTFPHDVAFRNHISRSRICQKRDKRSARARWQAIWSNFFPNETVPSSYHAEYIQDNALVAGSIRALPRDCRQSIRLSLQQHGIMGDAPGEAEVLDRVFGPLMTGSGMPQTGHDELPHGTNSSVPATNLVAVSPNSDPRASFGSITSRDYDPPSHTIDWSPYSDSLPRLQPQFSMYIIPDLDLSNVINSDTLYSIAQQDLPASVDEPYTPGTHQGQPNVQNSSHQYGGYRNTLSPDQASARRGGVPSDTTQNANYPHYPSTIDLQEQSSDHPTTARAFVPTSATFTPDFPQPDHNTGTILDQVMPQMGPFDDWSHYS